jgi:hypothetical protein
MMDEIKIRKIAKENDLHPMEEKVLVGFIQERFPNENSVSYVSEWATRIVKGSAFAHADTQSRKVLAKFGVNE